MNQQTHIPTQSPVQNPEQAPTHTPGQNPTEKKNQGFFTPSPGMNVGLLVWAAVLMVVGLVLVLVPAASIGSFQAVVVTLFLLTGLVFLALAYYLHKEGAPK